MRIHDPMKQWKLSKMDLESRIRWEDYTKAKEEMFLGLIFRKHRGISLRAMIKKENV